MHWSPKLVSDINVVPFVDVLLVLLVIFMLTAANYNQGVTVNLPEVTTSASVALDANLPIIITVNKSGKTYSNLAAKPEQAISLSTLTYEVAAALKLQPQRTLLVRGDAGASYQQIMTVINALRLAGAEQVGLVTNA